MASQPAVVVTLDGRLADPDEPLLHADDLAAVRGDGIFETLLVRDGRPCLLGAHLSRLSQSARMTDLPEPQLKRWRSAIEAAVERWNAAGGGEGVLRLVYSRGGGRGGRAAGRRPATRPSGRCPPGSPRSGRAGWPR